MVDPRTAKWYPASSTHEREMSFELFLRQFRSATLEGQLDPRYDATAEWLRVKLAR